MHEELDSAATFRKNFANSALVTSEIDQISCYADAECTLSASESGRSGDEVVPKRRPRQRLRPPTTLAPPVIGARLLTDPNTGFLDFLFDDDCRAYCAALFGEAGTAVATALDDFRKATEFHYFGHRPHKPDLAPPRNPGLLDATKAESRRTLKEFAQLAYRGDPERRGLLFWKRVAGLLWEAYAGLMKLRLQAEKIRLQETARIDQTWQKREARAAYMREYRASRPVKCQFDDSRKATDAPSTNTFDGNPTAVESTSDVKELA